MTFVHYLDCIYNLNSSNICVLVVYNCSTLIIFFLVQVLLIHFLIPMILDLLLQGFTWFVIGFRIKVEFLGKNCHLFACVTIFHLYSMQCTILHGIFLEHIVLPPGECTFLIHR